MEYGVCEPCRRTIHELAEIAFGEGMGGCIDLRVDWRAGQTGG
jgi:hypothetical protein